MTDTIRVQLGQGGVLVLPKALREQYNLQPGDTLTLLALGGVFILHPQPSEIDTLADCIQGLLHEEGETLETMWQAVRDERERYTGQN